MLFRSVNSIRYSVPVSWIGRRVEIRETREKIDIELDTRHIVTHDRALTPMHQRIMLAEHRPPRGAGVKHSDSHPEEKALIEAAPEIAPYISELKQKGRKVVTLALRQLLRLLREYPLRTVPRRGCRSGPLRTLRSRPAGTDDSAPCGARLLSDRRKGAGRQ